MPVEERWLPLFPLNTVLFPNASLPLQIFEERYKSMLQHCLDDDSKFGVVLIKSGSDVGEPAVPHSTGTVAQIIQVNRVEGDRMFIGVTGERRFRIKSITQRRPYIGAQVELLDEQEEWLPPTEMEAIRVAVTEHMRLIIGQRGGWVRESQTPSDPVALSYMIAGILQIGVDEKQVLLEEASAARRLESELELLRRESEGLKRLMAKELLGKYSRQ